MKIYLAGNLGGLNKNPLFPPYIREVKATLEDIGDSVYVPISLPSWQQTTYENLKALNKCRAILFPIDWERIDGCNVEDSVSMYLQLHRFYFLDDIKAIHSTYFIDEITPW